MRGCDDLVVQFGSTLKSVLHGFLCFEGEIVKIHIVLLLG